MTGPKRIHGQPRKYFAVSSILRNRGEILLLKRSESVETNKGRWSTVSGRVEEGRSPGDVALEEIEVETGLEPSLLKFVRQGEPLFVRPTGTAETQVYPLLFNTASRVIQLNWEHTDAVWVHPSKVDAYDTVPKFKLLLKRLDLL